MKEFKLGDWCKWFEKNFSPEVMIPELPVIIRLDGNNFHNWTKGLKRPFDERLTQLMTETTMELVKYTNARVGYTQSDEITLILYSDNTNTKIFNEGKKQKLLSKVTAHCVNVFNEKRKTLLPKHDKIAIFDCRIYQVPTLEWATKQLLWREKDATKNSIAMVAQSLFSHKSLQNLNSDQLQLKMLTEKNVNWNDLPDKFKRGTYILHKKITKKLSIDELDTLPEKHQARLNPDLIITRNVIEVADMPIFSKITNKVDVIFNSAKPKLYSEHKFEIGDLVKIVGPVVSMHPLTEDTNRYLNEICTIGVEFVPTYGADYFIKFRCDKFLNEEADINKESLRKISCGEIVNINGRMLEYVKNEFVNNEGFKYYFKDSLGQEVAIFWDKWPTNENLTSDEDFNF
jgi:tRNA(His) 5'-end guanylyltransferase